jgi:ketosteroid isomerase-like protein
MLLDHGLAVELHDHDERDLDPPARGRNPGLDDRAFCNGFVTYVRKDGSELTVPWSTVSRFEDGKLAEYLAYVDASKLFAP